MDPRKNYYKILKVSKNATQDEIQKAFRRMAKKHHPDVNPGDKNAEERFKEVNEANKVLGDRKKREEYDAIRKSAPDGGLFRRGWFSGERRSGLLGFTPRRIVAAIFFIVVIAAIVLFARKQFASPTLLIQLPSSSQRLSSSARALTVIAGPGGSVSVSIQGTDTSVVHSGNHLRMPIIADAYKGIKKEIKLTAGAYKGYSFKEWVHDDVVVSRANTATMYLSSKSGFEIKAVFQMNFIMRSREYCRAKWRI
ncbi:MAG: DnaJ domain-containing protein [Syntrophorhabdaceae bacterium]|nr:DnaJ domain-containing protein [Syntrophorhabdaceae bacterium]